MKFYGEYIPNRDLWEWSIQTPFEYIKRTMKKNDDFPLVKSEEEWRGKLSPFEYQVLREKGTERAFTGELYTEKRTGRYLCKACGQELFDSEAKYESGSGWPSYFKPLAPSSVKEESDRSHGMVRTEVRCSRCGSHLGHVFNDGPAPTGMRYCINSVSLDFIPEKRS